jgi:hypothetical protein
MIVNIGGIEKIVKNDKKDILHLVKTDKYSTNDLNNRKIL